jgi:hypothetical protein
MAAGVSIVLALWGAAPVQAHFERSIASSRQLALGGAMVSIATDASAAVINPAGLAELHRWSLVTTYQRPYRVADLDEGFAAGALRVGGVGAVGLAFHYVGLRDVMSESVLTLAVARDLIRTSEDASLSVGASLDLARVSASDRFDASESALTGGASVLLRPFPSIGMAYAMRNITEPEFDLVAGGGASRMERMQSWGLSYIWHQRVTVSYERGDDGRGWSDHVGLEVDLGPYLDVRSGVGWGSAAGGVGIAWRNLTFDAGFSSHEYLGSSYVVTVGYTPEAPGNPYAQTP